MAKPPSILEKVTAKPKFKQQPVSTIGSALLVICATAGAIAAQLARNQGLFVVGLLVGLYLAFAIKVADQWEKAAVLRLGRYRGLRGPGPFHIIPVVDSISRFIDQRVRVTDVTAWAP